MTRVLYLSSDSTRAENSGGRMRCSFIATALASFCELRVITLGDVAAPEDPTRFAPPWPVQEFPVIPESKGEKTLRMIGTAVRGRGFHAQLLCDAETWQKVAAALQDFRPQVIIFGNCFIAQLAEKVRAIAPSAKLVLDSHNVEWLLCQRLAGSKNLSWSQQSRMVVKSWFVKQIERRAAQSCDEIWAVSARDAEGLRRLAGKGVHVVPNAIHLDRYDSHPLRRENTVCFMGWFSYIPNEDAALFLLECSSELLRRGIAHRLTLAGRAPTSRMLERAQGMAQVEILPDVPDAKAAIAAADIFAVPLFSGSGTRFKILEAMALGRCVVTTPLGCEGLDCVSGQDLVISDSHRFVDALEGILKRGDEAAMIAAGGRRWIEQNHSPALTEKIIFDRIESLLQPPDVQN